MAIHTLQNKSNTFKMQGVKLDLLKFRPKLPFDNIIKTSDTNSSVFSKDRKENASVNTLSTIEKKQIILIRFYEKRRVGSR